MSVENLKLWDSLKTTDPKATKQFTRGGGFKGTAIKPMWAIWRATKEFGPIGVGWGWTEHQHVVESGMIFTQVSVWYCPPNEPPGTKAWSGPQWGGTQIFDGKREEIAAGRGRPDDESFKKSTTDAITKCLSYIGIGADVHMGQFDDTKYVLEAEKMSVEAERKDNAERIRLWIAGMEATIKAAATVDDLRTAYKTVSSRKADLTADQSKALFDAIDARKGQLAEPAAAE